ncbi:MAG TPA: hypothetical protein VFQ39_17795, partial [Longimicrobium sp.]|nr:hypothetical protein [Longimicrobium sp.]
MSQTDFAASSAPVFTPSELVVLFGDRFSEEGGMLGSKMEVLTSGKKVLVDRVAKTAIAAAVLAAEKAGAIRFDPRTGKAFFGMMKTKALHIVPGGSAAAFPAGSLEAFLAAAAAGQPKLEDALAHAIAEESYNAEEQIVFQIRKGLASRGLLDTIEKKTLKVFTSVSYALPDSTRAAAARENTDAIAALLANEERARPDLFADVRKAIQSALVHMTKS